MSQKYREEPESFRWKIFRMVSTGVTGETINQLYDIFSTAAVILNLIVIILSTFNSLSDRFGSVFYLIEQITVAFFAVDYFLRIYTAGCQYPELSEGKAILKYMTSGSGIIDLLSFLPFYLPVFFPTGSVVFRLLRVARILRLFRINAYYDSLNVITEVLASKKQQLLSSVFIILVLMVASSLCMYSLEHNAQPGVFKNAFSGIWWSVSTLLTIGYGDIYPITPLGKAFGILISFLGVGMVAIPTGIISAGFVEQYSRLSQLAAYGEEMDSQFIRVCLKKKDDWTGKMIRDLSLPENMLIASVKRGPDILVPSGDLVLKTEDTLLIAAESLEYRETINLKEVILHHDHSWNGTAIRDLDISRQTLVVLIKRNGKTLIPKEDLILLEGDQVFLYTKMRTK